MQNDTNIETLAKPLGTSRNVVLCLGHNGSEFSVGYVSSSELGSETLSTLKWHPTLRDAVMQFAQEEEVNSPEPDRALSDLVLEAAQRESILCLAKESRADSWGVFSMQAAWLQISPMHSPMGLAGGNLGPVIASVKKSCDARYGIGLRD